MKSLKKEIEDALDAEVVIEGDDGCHLAATVISDQFQGLPLLQRHRKVKSLLKERFKEQIHALSLKTYTREEWNKK